jgi:hypothetical protein
MFKWAPFVMVRICLFFLGGVVLAIYQPQLFSFRLVSMSVVTAAVVYALVYFFLAEASVRKMTTGFIGLSAIFLSGYLLVLQKTDSRNPDNLIQWLYFAFGADQTQFVVYQIPDHTAFEFIFTGQSYFFADSMLMNDNEKIHFHINTNRTMANVAAGNLPENNSSFQYTGNAFSYIDNKRILWINSKDGVLPSNIEADYTRVNNEGGCLLPSIIDRKLGRLILNGSVKHLRNTPLDNTDIFFMKAENAFVTKI